VTGISVCFSGSCWPHLQQTYSYNRIVILVELLVVDALVGAFVESCVLEGVDFQLRQVAVSLYFFGEVLIEFVFDGLFACVC